MVFRVRRWQASMPVLMMRIGRVRVGVCRRFVHVPMAMAALWYHVVHM